MTQRALAASRAVTPRNITGLLDALQEEGLVARDAHPTDRRATLVSLTRKGREFTSGLRGGARRTGRSAVRGPVRRTARNFRLHTEPRHRTPQGHRPHHTRVTCSPRIEGEPLCGVVDRSGARDGRQPGSSPLRRSRSVPARSIALAWRHPGSKRWITARKRHRP
ncbi:MarR family transcriptional regulator [Streptomyces sp. cf386]|uniref:MarR family transcriptional regulator n=1 Tax=Streptomyces sp. cf386 TaxID=1761904 RepID=UPI003523A10F